MNAADLSFAPFSPFYLMHGSGQTRQARDGRRGPPGGAWAGPGAHCGVGPAWVLGLFGAQTPIRGARWSAERHSLSRPSQVAKAPYCALLSAQPRPAAGRATPWPPVTGLYTLVIPEFVPHVGSPCIAVAARQL